MCFTVQILQGEDISCVSRSAIFIGTLLNELLKFNYEVILDTEGSFDHFRASMIGEATQELLVKISEKYNRPNIV